MAHVGKIYPVHVRRDWSTEIFTYRMAAARTYMFITNTCAGTIGGHLGNFELVAEEYMPRAVDIPEWRSPFTLINGRNVQIVLNLTTQNTDGSMQHKMEIFDSIQGSVARGSGTWVPNYKYAQLAGTFDQSWQPRPVLFNLIPNSSYRFAARKWDGTPFGF